MYPVCADTSTECGGSVDSEEEVGGDVAVDADDRVHVDGASALTVCLIFFCLGIDAGAELLLVMSC